MGIDWKVVGKGSVTNNIGGFARRDQTRDTSIRPPKKRYPPALLLSSCLLLILIVWGSYRHEEPQTRLEQTYRSTRSTNRSTYVFIII